MVELSSLDVRLLALELRALEDGYVDKVYETRPGEFVLKLRHPQAGPVHLLVRPGAWAARTSDPPVSPETPTTVALHLRKLLTGARIRRIDQHEFDRVLRLQLERHGEPIELIVELFGKGNLLVAGPDRTLLFALRTETFAHRTIRRGEKLVFPPPRVNPLTLPKTEFEERAQASDKDTVRFLALDLALGGDLAEELVHRAGLDKDRKVSGLEADELDRLWSALRGLVEGGAKPAVASTVKGPQVQSLVLEAPLFRDAQRETVASLSEAILRVAALETEAQAPKPDDEAARLERQIVHQERGVVELGREADRWERRGHLLYAHYTPAAQALQKSKATIEATSWAAFEERVRARADEPGSWTEAVASVDPKRARILVRLEDEEVPLDPFLSLEQNATILYDESKRIRAKQESAKAALADAKKRLGERRSAAPAAPKPAAQRAPAKRFWFDALRWFYSSEGFLVVAGRDAASNEKLVKRHLSQGDRYGHADVQGAASVVVKCEKKTPGEPTMREACQFAATHSKAFAQFAAADAYWVHPEQVSKTAESGEYVPKGAFVIRGARNYFPKMKLELALGVVHLDAQGRPGTDAAPHRRLMGGPPDAVRKHTDRLALIERGEQKPSDAAKELAPVFGVSLDEVIAALPAGTVRIAKRPEARP
jgi:predicted ribosome quality control (RQC) complex YloA/Tae2 family protein